MKLKESIEGGDGLVKLRRMLNARPGDKWSLSDIAAEEEQGSVYLSCATTQLQLQLSFALGNNYSQSCMLLYRLQRVTAMILLNKIVQY